MTDNIDARVDELLDGEPDPGQFRPKSGRTLFIGGLTIVVILIAAIALPFYNIRAKETEFRQNLDKRLTTLAQSRGALVAAWLDGILVLGDRVVDSDFFKLFATEVDLNPDDLSNVAAPPDENENEENKDESVGEPTLEAQLPLMKNVLTEYIQNTGFLAAHMISRKGSTYVSTDFYIVRTDAQKAIAMEVFKTGNPFFAPVVAGPQGFVMDIYLPIFPPQATAEDNKVVGVLLLSRPTTEKLAEFVAAPAFAEPGENLHLVQVTNDTAMAVRPGQVPPLMKIGGTAGLESERKLGFAKRASVAGQGQVFSVAQAVPRTAWVLVQEIDAGIAQADIRSYIQTSISLAVLVVLAVIIAFGAFWWWLVGDHNKNLATQFQRFAAQIAAQKRFLDSINNTIQDYIGLKDRDGNYRYVNPAFARAVGRPIDRLLGHDDEAIFGHGTAERLKLSDNKVLETGQAVTVDEEIFLESKKHYMQISKVPLRDEEEQISGLVSVIRDISDVVEQRHKRELAVKQTVVALVRAIELRDPYLGGHSRRVAGFATAIAHHMDVSPEQASTIEVAANLSQIGKLSISRALLNKPDRLTEEEVKTIQGHVDHAASVLKDLDFGLPVFEVIYQMNERLDGGGYPEGLAADEISLEGRILAVCDVFCARIEPRSYRPAITPLEAVDILESNNTRYDDAVVKALRVIVESPQGDRLIQDLSAE